MEIVGIYRPGQPNWEYLVVNIPQCGNVAILLPFWFYVKSICDFRGSKNAVSTILQALNFDFLEKFHNWKCQKFAKIHLELLKWSKWQFCRVSNWPKLISRKFWMADIFILCIPNYAAQVCTKLFCFCSWIGNSQQRYKQYQNIPNHSKSDKYHKHQTKLLTRGKITIPVRRYGTFDLWLLQISSKPEASCRRRGENGGRKYGRRRPENTICVENP